MKEEDKEKTVRDDICLMPEEVGGQYGTVEDGIAGVGSYKSTGRLCLACPRIGSMSFHFSFVCSIDLSFICDRNDRNVGHNN